MSSNLIVLNKVTGSNKFDGRTPDGTFLPAKSYLFHFFNVETPFFTTQRNTAHYAILGSSGQPIGTVAVVMNTKHDLLGPFRFDVARRTSIGKCTVSPAEDVITLFDPSGPVGSEPASSAPTSSFRPAVPHEAFTFLVYNLTSHSIRLNTVFGDTEFEGRTPDCSILGPDSAWHFFNLVAFFFKRQRAVARYSIFNGQNEVGLFDVVMEAVTFRREASCDTLIGTCIASPARDVIFLRPPLA